MNPTASNWLVVPGCRLRLRGALACGVGFPSAGRDGRPCTFASRAGR